MLPQRPDITVRIPNTIRPGDTFEVLVTLTSTKEQALEDLNITFVGYETIWDRYNNNRANRERLVGKVASFGKKVLQPGDNEYSCKFPLDTNLPPSYQTQWYQIQYEIEVHAAIAWWPDARESFLVKVQTPNRTLTGKPQLMVTAAAIQGKDPYLEASLSSNVLYLGGYCVGAVSLGNTALNKYQKLSVGLVGMHPKSYSQIEELHHRYTEIPIGTPSEGQSFPFRFQVPLDLTPSFKGKISALEWGFEVRAAISWKSDCWRRIPITLLPQQSAANTSPREAPPTVGSIRLQNLWKSVAARFALQFEGDRMSGEESGAHILLTREQRTDGLYLVGRLSFPSLQLRLQIQPASGLGRLFSHSINIEGAEWSKASRITGRDDVQIKAFLAPLSEQLEDLDEVQVTDEQFTLVKRDSGHHEEPLLRFVQRLSLLAKQIENARAQIPAPKELQEGYQEWLQMASSLSARLENSRMAIFGELDGTPFSLITQWPLEANLSPRTELTLHVQNPQSTHQSLDLKNKTASSLSHDATEIINQLSANAQLLKIEAEQLSLHFPKIFLSPLALRVDLDLLQQLSMVLRSGTGPYR